jgi:3-oxoacid CoA-transferase subunit B
MEHTAKGEARIVKECSLPLTGKGVVHLIITDLAVFEVHKDENLSLRLIDKAPDISLSEIRMKTNAEFIECLG